MVVAYYANNSKHRITYVEWLRYTYCPIPIPQHYLKYRDTAQPYTRGVEFYTDLAQNQHEANTDGCICIHTSWSIKFFKNLIYTSRKF